MENAPSLHNRRILVVEDDYLIARAVCDLLEAAGAVILGPVGKLAEALDLIARQQATLHAAVLDIDLHGEQCYPVADILARSAVHVVLTTGYSTDAVAESHRHLPRCQKPLDRATLLAALTPSPPA